jgi:hypothetical protein
MLKIRPFWSPWLGVRARVLQSFNDLLIFIAVNLPELGTGKAIKFWCILVKISKLEKCQKYFSW